MSIKLIITLSLLTFVSINSKAQEKFILEGFLTGYAKGVKFVISPHLDNMNPNRDKDSTFYLDNGKFKIIRNINKPTLFTLRALPKMPEDNPIDFEYISFWAENKPMILKGEKGVLKYSDVSGSIIQDQFEELINETKKLELINKHIKDSILTYKLSKTDKISLRERYKNNNFEIEKKSLDFTYKHPNYYSCVANLITYINYMPYEISKTKVIEFYNNLNNDFKSNAYGKQIKAYIDNNEKPYKLLKTKDKAINFTLPDSLKNDISLKSLKGKFILLDFWASGCGPCRKEHKNYLKVYNKYKLKDFEILSVSQDQSKKQWINAMQKDNMIWKSVWDSDRKITKKYNIRALPTNYLIDKKGFIIAKNVRGEALENLLKTKLNTK